MPPSPRLCAPVIGLALIFCAPASEHPTVDTAKERDAVVRTMERYMVHARAVNADSVAAFYAPNGTILEPGIFPISTPDSIRAFMASFPGVRVDVATATPDIVEVFGETALLWGSYFERLAFPGQPVSEQHGKFVIEWKKQPSGDWRIARHYRVPLPAASPPAAHRSP